MHRPISRLLALGSLLLATTALPALGCGDDGGGATALAISLKTDLAAGTEYTSVRVEVYASTDKSLKSPLSEHELRAGQLARPIVINAGGQSAVLVKVTAIGTSGGAPVVVQVLKASFSQGKTQVLEVFVSAACADVSCDAGSTCLGQRSGSQCEGSCVSIPEPDLRELTQAGDEDAWRPVLCGSVGSGDGGAGDAGGPDAGRPDGGSDAATSCSLSLPGAACDLVSQCGCAPKEQCVLEQVSATVFAPACVADASGGTPFGICDTDLDCPPSYGCVNPGLCLPYCNTVADCPAAVPSSCDALGSGSGSTLAGVRVCAVTCSTDGDCVSGDQYCSTTGKCVPRPDLGEACDARSGCLDGICIVETAGAATGTCKFQCASNGECASGCCVEISDGSTICGEASTCAPGPGSTCATGTRPPYAGCSAHTDCCGGDAGLAYCIDLAAQDEPARKFCAQHCTTSADCGASECCTDWNATIGNVCQPRAYVTAEGWACL